VATRCKMVANEVVKPEQEGGSAKVAMYCVTGDNPSGNLQLWITNPAAFDLFEQGKKYYVTIEEAPE